MYTNAQVAALLADTNAALARIEAALSSAPSGTVVAAPVAVAVASPVVIPERGAKREHVGCSLHAGKSYAVGTDPTRGIAYHRTWCKGENVAIA